MFDDHMYCPTCNRHSVECYCFNIYAAEAGPRELVEEYPPDGPCLNHDMRGDEVPVDELLDRVARR